VEKTKLPPVALEVDGGLVGRIFDGVFHSGIDMRPYAEVVPALHHIINCITIHQTRRRPAEHALARLAPFKFSVVHVVVDAEAKRHGGE